MSLQKLVVICVWINHVIEFSIIYISSLHVWLVYDVMLRSHLERSPAEFVELSIWASSESSSGFGRALCDSRIQIGCLAYIFRTQVQASCGGLRPVVNPLLYQSAGFRAGPSGECHKLGQTFTRWGGPQLNACSMGKFIFLSGLWAMCQRGAKSLEKLAAL